MFYTMSTTVRELAKGRTLAQAEARFRGIILADALSRNGGNSTKAAAELGIHRNTFHRSAEMCGVRRMGAPGGQHCKTRGED